MDGETTTAANFPSLVFWKEKFVIVVSCIRHLSLSLSLSPSLSLSFSPVKNKQSGEREGTKPTPSSHFPRFFASCSHDSQSNKLLTLCVFFP